MFGTKEGREKRTEEKTGSPFTNTIATFCSYCFLVNFDYAIYLFVRQSFITDVIFVRRVCFVTRTENTKLGEEMCLFDKPLPTMLEREGRILALQVGDTDY